MEKSVEVPLYLLDAILRLVDGFDDLDGLDFHKCGYSPRFEYENAIWEFQMKIWQLKCHLTEAYLLTISNVTGNENRALLEWIEAGNSVYCNPCYLHDDSGCMMDFINGCRITAEMAEDPSRFYGNVTDSADDSGWDDDLPF